MPRPQRRQPSSTSGYRLLPPRLWHYGHGGGDGSAEAEQARHQGAGTVFAPFLRGDSRCWAVPHLEAGRPWPQIGQGRQAGGSAGARPALPEPQPLTLAAAAREACGAPTWGWAWAADGGCRGGGREHVSSDCLFSPLPWTVAGQRRRGAACQVETPGVSWVSGLPGWGDV